ncbi:MAG: HAD-superfamily hydrolase, subfamily [Clostridia bacterium]|nr:HAD-superfamily hydrolase, subfamily [Clostridia bacterium]
MKNFENYLLVSDLDGTLISTDTTISQRNKAAINKFISEGGQFIVATGRDIHNTLPCLEGLDSKGSCILFNGGGIYDFNKREFLTCEFLDKEKVIQDIKWILEKHENLFLLVFTKEETYIIDTHQILGLTILKERPTFKFTSINNIIHKEWLKVIFRGPAETLFQCNEYLKDSIKKDMIHTVFSDETSLEVLPFGVSKGAALKKLIKLKNLQNKKVIAIGDYDNDIEMLVAADIGIATANASEGAKKSADQLTVSNDEDAIAEVITHILPTV